MRTVKVKLSDGTIVEGELVVAERVKVEEKYFKWVPESQSTWKGKQRQIVVDILMAAEDEMEFADIVTLAEEAGLEAIGGVRDSVKYHLNHLVKAGCVETN